ncbi:glucokinase [Nitzschia inconspicua]|uniref:Glucokinase n=1 Tax=Nitzschia inconspicua TaxID=303405 RepID=A0A9K3Q689_9STRA|nr:glucokinase [Nitzschia inconspicua]
MTTFYLLTGDIGGTNSRMGLYSVNCNTPLCIKTYRNAEYITKDNAQQPGVFEKNIMAPFLQHCWDTVPNLAPIELTEIIASLAIAGPVKNNQVIMSNLFNAEINGNAIAKSLHCKSDPYMRTIQVCKIINDFVAQGYGCLTLQANEVKELTPGSLKMMDPTGPKACVGAGTGLGECFLTPDQHGVYSCFASEGGHVEWAPRTDLEVAVWNFLKNKFAHKHRISVERVVSGTGLANCYEAMASLHPDQVDKALQKEFEEAGDLQGKVVADNAKKNDLCRMAMEMMMTSYGSEVGSVGIKLIPTGGLYVTGGLTPKNLEWIEGKDTCFMKAYRDKGRVSPILENVPLFAVLTEDLGVRGAIKSAQMEYETYKACKEVGGTIKSSSIEKDLEFYKYRARVCLAFAVGVVVGITCMKKS